MAKDRTIDLLLVRSGTTAWEEAGRLQGGADLPLCPVGQAGLTDLVGEAADSSTRLKLVLTGPDEASVSTGEALAEKAGARMRVVEGLAGVKLGLWEGLLDKELSERSPKAYRSWRQDPTSATPPDGEQTVEAQQRLLKALSRALERGPKEGAVAVVLRPEALGLVRCALEEQNASDLWEVLERTPSVSVTRQTRARLKGLSKELSESA